MKGLRLVLLLIGASAAVLAVFVEAHRRFPKTVQRTPAGQEARVQLSVLGPSSMVGTSGVSILDGGKIWTVGYDGHDPRRLFYSGDWGHTWEIRPVQSSGFTLKSITFADDQHGWAVGGYGTILRTTDGGNTWEQAKRVTYGELQEVRFFNVDIGYAVGSKALRHRDRETDITTFGVIALRTSDGGRTWRTTYEDNSSRSLGLVLVSENEAVGSLDNHIIRTDDGGLTWQIAPEVVDFGPAFRHPDGTVWGSRSDGGLFRSLDHGKSWQLISHLPTFDMPAKLIAWWDLAFADEKLGIAVGYRGHLAVTQDGGLTWLESETGINEDLMSVWLKGKRGLIVGSDNLYQVTVP